MIKKHKKTNFKNSFFSFFRNFICKAILNGPELFLYICAWLYQQQRLNPKSVAVGDIDPFVPFMCWVTVKQGRKQKNYLGNQKLTKVSCNGVILRLILTFRWVIM
jgi:hypothetical protein